MVEPILAPRRDAQLCCGDGIIVRHYVSGRYAELFCCDRYRITCCARCLGRCNHLFPQTGLTGHTVVPEAVDEVCLLLIFCHIAYGQVLYISHIYE